MKRKSNLVVVVILFLFSNSSYAATASFQGLGDLPGGLPLSTAIDCSDDGSVVVGCSSSALVTDYEAFRWENGQMIGLGGLAVPGGWLRDSFAFGVSADGSVVVGDSYSESGSGPVVEAFRWENGVMVGLGDLPGGEFGSGASDVSADGSVVVGEGISDSGVEAFRWENGVMTGLGYLPGGDYNSQALAVSSDGSVVAGWGWSLAGEGKEAFRWTEETGMVGLGYLPGGDFDSRAYGISADGSVIVGYGTSALGTEAFRWENGQMIGLGDLPEGDFDSRALGVSADGSVIVGHSRWSEFVWDAFIWDADNGMRNLQDVLVNDCGLDLTGWVLGSANGISADGLTIVGSGRNPDGYTEAWVATIPEPATLLLLGLGGLFLRRRS